MKQSEAFILQPGEPLSILPSARISVGRVTLLPSARLVAMRTLTEAGYSVHPRIEAGANGQLRARGRRRGAREAWAGEGAGVGLAARLDGRLGLAV